MEHNRRTFLTGATGLVLSYSSIPRFDLSQEKKGTRLILLGTRGGPRVGASGRSNPSTLLLINGVPYVIDCGYGAFAVFADPAGTEFGLYEEPKR